MRIRTLAAASAAVLAGFTMLPAASATGGAPGSAPPNQDPFYTAPSNISTYTNGQVVGSRAYSSSLVAGASAWQISYRTNDSHGAPELGVTTLIVPQLPWVGTGSRPVVSMQSPEDSTGEQCAPSYTIATNNDAQDAGLVWPLLAAGWAVAVPDYEGPGSHYTAGPQAGHAVLDGIRAVRNFGQGGITTANPWAIDGYSGGAQATGWAAQLQPSYAPELKLVGAAMGGTPADLTALARNLEGGPFSGFEFAAAWGIDKEWPEAGIDSILNAQGQADFAAIANQCESTILSNFSGKKLSADSTVADPLSYPSVAAVLNQDKLGQSVPTTPIYDYHAETDEIVPVAQDDTMVSSWCSMGATITKVRDLVGEHVEEAVLERPAVVAWLASRFNGVPTTNTCGLY